MEKKFEEKVIAVLNVEESNMKTYRKDLRIVSWIVDGKVNPPKLELRQYVLNSKSGYMQMGKAFGFGIKELNIIAEKWDEIMQLMGTKIEPKEIKTEANITKEEYDDVFK